MKRIFNIIRNIFAIIGLVLSIAMVIVLCSDEYAAIRGGVNQESVSHIESLKLSGPYGRDKVKFNIHPVIDSERATEIKEYFQLDTLYDETASTWEKTLAIARFVATNIPHANQTIQPEKRNAIYLWEYTKNTLPNTGIQCSVSNAIQRFFPVDDPRAKVFTPEWTPSWDDYKRLGFDSRADLLYILEKIGK